jgi:hypothetical protein
VPRGLVLVDALTQPDDPLDAQVLAEVPLDVRSGLARIPVRVEQALLGRDEGPFPVDLDGAALRDQARRVTGLPLDLEHLLADQVVLVPLGIEALARPAPRVERPVDAADRASGADEKRRPAVTDPGVVGRHLHETNGMG